MKRTLNFRKGSILVLALCIMALNGSLSAQSTAALQGTVLDPSGSVVSGATITVRNEATGLQRTTQTDDTGNYLVAALPVGVYQVEVTGVGFQKQTVSHLKLDVSQTVTQNFQLKVGALTEEVTVAAGAPVIETSTITVGQVIDQKTVQEIPLNGRHFVDLGLLIPGSVTPPQNGFLTAPLRGQGSFAFNTAGNREDTVNFLVNGINLNDMVQNQITFQPSINTVAEFKVDNSTFSAEYGRNSGAITNIATRSGTNEFHGEVLEFLRNDALDARNFFDGSRKGPFKRNQFGAAVGGPIRRDNTFFFFSYEGLRHRQGLTINGNVLTDEQRSRAVSDPNASLVTRRLLDYIPRANRDTGIFQGAATAPVDIDQWTGDISATLTKDDRLHGYYAIQRDKRGEPTLQGNTIPNFGDTRRSRRQIMTLNETHTFSPSLVNEARFGFNRIFITFTPNAKINPAELGINNGVTEPIGLPQMTVGGIGLNFGGPAGFPQGRGDMAYVFSDTASYQAGRHAFRIGGEFRRFFNNNFSKDTGAFTFANVDDFIRGNANGFNITLGDVSSSIRTGALGFFAQDSFKWQSNLTLELGLRYEWFMTPGEKFDRLVVFEPVTASLVRLGSGRDRIYHQGSKNIQPRVGFAWDPFKDGKTSVRAAYAILADQPVTNFVGNLAANPPLANPVAFVPSGSSTTNLATALSQAAASGLNPSSVDTNFDNAYIQSWNLNVQREIARGLGVMVGYFGTKGTHLRIARNINQRLAGGARPFPTVSPASAIRPGAALNNITEVGSAGNSSYNALWVTATQRLTRGLQFNTSYTWSKSLDYNSLNSQGVVVQDSYNIRGDRGRSDYDATHRLVISGLYELPWRGNLLVEGWQLSTIIQAQSGNPVNILAGNLLANADYGLSALGSNTLTGLATIRPDLLGSVSVNDTPRPWFTNTVCDPRDPRVCPAGAVFGLPYTPGPGFHFGNLGRNVIIGPKFTNVDFSIIKNTKITERQQLQFRVEFFDLFNHANLGQPGRIAQRDSTAFGIIQNTRFATGDSGSSRQIQFALKYLF